MYTTKSWIVQNNICPVSGRSYEGGGEHFCLCDFRARVNVVWWSFVLFGLEKIGFAWENTANSACVNGAERNVDWTCMCTLELTVDACGTECVLIGLVLACLSVCRVGPGVFESSSLF